MMHLSGGMKRRVMIAKALSHEPEILFLDEPTAGVDVELRRDMWDLVRKLREDGTTIILTTHYIEEAEEMADRVGVISRGELIAVDEKRDLMVKMGKKTLDIMLVEPLATIPPELSDWKVRLENDGHVLCYEFDSHAERTGIASLMRRLSRRWASPTRTCRPTSRASRIFSSSWCTGIGCRHEHARHRGHLPFRNGALEAHPVAEPDHPGDHHRALFRGVRIRAGHRA